MHDTTPVGATPKRQRSSNRLREYRQKRAFGRTPEPSPARLRPRRLPKHLFMVHKHDARRLHYDLRLEMDGALASWAIPKGPSYDPAQRRLAVQTEDHPLAYGAFEGRIPEGEYGAGDSIIWDRGTYETDPPDHEAEMRRKGHLTLVLNGDKLKGRWHLVRTRPLGGKQQWLFFKGKDALVAPDYDVVAERPESIVSGKRVTRGPLRSKVAEAPHPDPISLLVGIWPPMKATLSNAEAVARGAWIFEVKYDGYRALAGVSVGHVALQSRNARDLAARFPDIARALADLEVAEAVLDGEIVAELGRRDGTFENLQTSTGEHRYYVFDLLWLDGEDLRQRPIEERRDLLESVLANAPDRMRLAERVPGPIDKALAAMRRRRVEGVVGKRAGSTYQGTRSHDWLKVKLVSSQELAIVGFTPSSDENDAIGALLVAVFDEGVFRYAGKVGTGFSRKTRAELFKRLSTDRVTEPPVVDAPRSRVFRWVRPKRVAEVAFTEWTRDGKLRHPSFRGLRIDKSPEECVRELVAPHRRARPRS
jgi:bifunctional non-homologous end joining protein LigD